MKTDEDLLEELVLGQIQQDITDGDVTAVFEMFKHIPRDILIGFLSDSRQEEMNGDNVSPSTKGETT